MKVQIYSVRLGRNDSVEFLVGNTRKTGHISGHTRFRKKTITHIEVDGEPDFRIEDLPINQCAIEPEDRFDHIPLMSG